MQSSLLLPQYGSAMNLAPRSKDGHSSPDTSLTSLNWLPDFKIGDFQFSDSSLLPPNTTITNTCSSINDDVFSSTTSSADSDREAEKEPCVIPLSPLKRCMNQAAEFDRNPWKYRENPKKPPLAYTALIYLAIKSTNKEKVMLGEIYQWIKDNFMYYRIAESTWQNSVRHNLSLNEFFLKIPRSEGDPGKGSFWRVNPSYDYFLSNEGELQRLQEQQHGSQKLPVQRSRNKGRRRVQSTSTSRNKTTGNSKRRSKSVSLKEEVCPLPGELNWTTLLNTQKVNNYCDIVCRPSYSSPILGPPDTMHMMCDQVVCSPAVIPHSLIHKTLDTPPLPQTYTMAPTNGSIEDIIESPSLLLPAWAESRPQSPNPEHPWAETKDVVGGNKTVSSWSPDTPWTVSLTGYNSTSDRKRPILLN